MKKKYILIALLVLAVGFAAVSTTLIINGTANIKKNSDDFKVYYSKALVNGIEDNSVVVDDTHLAFKTTLDTLGQSYVLDYDVTNSSKQYDAQLTMNCTGGNEYLTVVNTFNTADNLLATDTRRGKLTLTLAKSYSGADLDVEIKCTLGANAVERDSEGTGTPAAPVEPAPIYEPKQGDELCIGTECFYLISADENEVALLAKYNLNVGGHSSVSSYTPYEEYTGIQDNPASTYVYGGGISGISHDNVIDFWDPEDDDKYLEFYENYLRDTYGVENTTGAWNNKNLEAIGCDSETFTCETYPSWLGEDGFTTDIEDGYDSPIGYEGFESGFSYYDQETALMFTGNPTLGVRPVVTISTDTFNDLFGDKILLDPLYFCNELGYTYGMFRVNPYGLAVEEGNYDDALYICSNDEDYEGVYGYDIHKNRVYVSAPLG